MSNIGIDTIKHNFSEEGFLHVYERDDSPGTVYDSHYHTDRVSLYIIAGSVTLFFDDETHTITAGQRFDVPIGKKHHASVGPTGCSYIVAEMIDGDS